MFHEDDIIIIALEISPGSRLSCDLNVGRKSTEEVVEIIFN
jgi:hypothetical protein